MTALFRSVSIPDNKLEIMAIRIRGTDGQYVSETSTAIHLRFDIRASSPPEYHKKCLLATSHHLISGDGIIIVKAQEYRSRGLSRGAATSRLMAVIKELTAV